MINELVSHDRYIIQTLGHLYKKSRYKKYFMSRTTKYYPDYIFGNNMFTTFLTNTTIKHLDDDILKYCCSHRYLSQKILKVGSKN